MAKTADVDRHACVVIFVRRPCRCGVEIEKDTLLSRTVKNTVVRLRIQH